MQNGIGVRFWCLLCNGGVNPTLLAAKNPGKDVQSGLLRLVAGVGRDIDGLPERSEDRVHDIRVRMKKFRAVLHLAESALKRPAFAKTDKLARRLKDHFGSLRDDDVLAELLLDLLDRAEALATAATLGLKCTNSERTPDTAPARKTCVALALLVEGFHLENLSGDEIAGAWLASYRSSRQAMSACRRDTKDDTAFHEWRKRVKQLLYQSAAIGPPLDKHALKADRLAAVLGAHHDLSILTDRLAGSPVSSKAERAALKRKCLVARRALAMGRKLFAEKPSAVRGKVRLP
jgi:CHAD domain-containing protein